MNKLFKSFKLLGIALISLLICIVLGNPLVADNTGINKLYLLANKNMPALADRLYQPKILDFTTDSFPQLEKIEQAYNSLEKLTHEQQMRIPLSSKNPRDNLIAEGTINPSNGKEIPITVKQARNMYIREAERRDRMSRNGFSANQKQSSTLLASMDLSNLAQYRECFFVNAYGEQYDRCLIDLVVRDYNSGEVGYYKGVFIDRFCEEVMKAHLEKTWL